MFTRITGSIITGKHWLGERHTIFIDGEEYQPGMAYTGGTRGGFPRTIQVQSWSCESNRNQQMTPLSCWGHRPWPLSRSWHSLRSWSISSRSSQELQRSKKRGKNSSTWRADSIFYSFPREIQLKGRSHSHAYGAFVVQNIRRLVISIGERGRESKRLKKQSCPALNTIINDQWWLIRGSTHIDVLNDGSWACHFRVICETAFRGGQCDSRTQHSWLRHQFGLNQVNAGRASHTLNLQEKYHKWMQKKFNSMEEFIVWASMIAQWQIVHYKEGALSE